MPASNGGNAVALGLTLYPILPSSLFIFDPTNFNDQNSGGIYNWKVEDVIAGRTPTVNRAIISYRDLGIATFNFTLAGTNDSGQVIGSTTSVTVGTNAASNRIATVVIGISLSAQNLQASIGRSKNTGPLSITKLRLEGKVETTTY